MERGNLLSPDYKKPNNCSSAWSSVCFGASLLRQGIIWRIGNGESTHFWTDNWSSIGILSNLAIDPSMIDEDLLVQNFWVENEWDSIMLYACLPAEIVERILCIPISNSRMIFDKPIWQYTPTGKFSVNSAYHGKWKHIWRFPAALLPLN